MWDRLREQLKKMGIQRELEEELRAGVALEARAAEARQARIAADSRRNPRRGIEGLGQTTMRMDPFWRALADVQFGRGWSKDKATVRKLLQQHPEFAAPYARKATVRVDGLKPQGKVVPA